MKKLVRSLNACERGEEDEEENYVKTTTTKTQQQPAVTIADTQRQTTKTAVNYKNTKTKTTKTTTAVDTSKTKTTKAYTKQVTITSEPDEVSTPCTIGNNYNKNKNITQQQQQQLPLKANNNGAELSASDLLMQETSLMIIEPTTVKSEARPPTVVAQTTMPTTTTTTTETATTTMSELMIANVQVPITHTGAISRIPSSLTSYDLPPAKPHTYAAARSGERGDSSPLIRGPLGMPLSALTASSSTYAMPSTAYQQRAKPLPASASAPDAATNSLITTTNAATNNIQTAHNIPGQIMDTTTIIRAETTNSTVNARTPHPATTSHVSFSNGRVQNNSLAPPSKFEPELLLSPAKLGQ